MTRSSCASCAAIKRPAARAANGSPVLTAAPPPGGTVPPTRKRGAMMTAVYNRSLRGDQRCPASWSGRSSRRIARAGLHSCKTELRHQLRSHGQRDLLGLLANLEQQGFIESETHYRLTAKVPLEFPPAIGPARARSTASHGERTATASKAHTSLPSTASATPPNGRSPRGEHAPSALPPHDQPARNAPPPPMRNFGHRHTADGRSVHLHRHSTHGSRHEPPGAGRCVLNGLA